MHGYITSLSQGEKTEIPLNLNNLMQELAYTLIFLLHYIAVFANKV